MTPSSTTTATTTAAPSPALALAPDARLFWTGSADDAAPALARLHRRFESDWREGLFALSAGKIDPAGSASLRFWRTFGDAILTRLCHVPATAAVMRVSPPPAEQFEAWAMAAPPMTGGEYLSAVMLARLWRAMEAWLRAEIPAVGELHGFLAQRAPQWQQVGSVCFHLAENRDDPDRPFAFMATATTGFTAAGRLRHVPLEAALERYVKGDDRHAVVKLLQPVHRAASACQWVDELAGSGRIYQPMAWTPEQAHEMLLSVPTLEECGLSVRTPDWWSNRPRPQVAVTIDEADSVTLDSQALLDFQVDVALGDTTLTPAEIQELLEGDDGLVLMKGQWVELDRERLREALNHWQELEQQARRGDIGFIEGMRLLAGAPADLRLGAAGSDEQAERRWAHVTAGAGLRRLLQDLRHPERRAGEPPPGLQAELRPYQRDGLAWLDLVTGLGLGACLADDMGLGKTVQVLALLLHRKAAEAAEPGTKKTAKKTAKKKTKKKTTAKAASPGATADASPAAPSLLVVPASLLGNWRHEAGRFAPSLKLKFLHPSECDPAVLAKIAEDPVAGLEGVDLAVTTYAMLTRQPWLAEVRWRTVILDEAQAIKNAGTRQSRAARALPAAGRIALTGTPIENRVGDLWSLFDFLNPGLLGSAATFKGFVKDLQSREDDQYGPLRRLTAPYILRRMKTDRSIIADLPEKTHVRQSCTLTPRQARDYQRVVDQLQRTLAETDGMKRRGAVLQAMMRLKQVCNHPSHLRGDDAYEPSASGKFIRLREICQELAERQERVLVFTQFREVIGPLSGFLAEIFGRDGLVLHGGTSVKQRRGLVDRFQAPDGPPFMVLSLKAGGTGLNLTAASHVIHFDRWWNPAVEDQATDRAFRIGQERNVLVHALVVDGTIEERIDAMIHEKRGIAAGVLHGGGELNVTELSDEALMDLVRLDISRAG